MLIAIGIYQESQASGSAKKLYTKLQAVPPVKPGLQEFNALANFEATTLQNMETFDRFYFDEININDRREFHYLKKIGDNTIIVLVSKKKIDCDETRNELFFLMHNIEQVHCHGGKLKITLQHILDNPIGYTRHDVLIESLNEKLLETKMAALEALDAMLRRGDCIETLKSDTERLAKASNSFQIQAKNLNRGCCW